MILSEIARIDPTFGLVPWVVLLPIIGLLLNVLIGKRLGELGIGLIASLASGASFVISILLMLALGHTHGPVTVSFLDWITAPGFTLGWNFRVDTLSVTMMLVVSGVGTLIHIYATSYMHSDVRYNGEPSRYRRFFVFLNLFIADMMLLVSANNYLMLFVGWEGVGLCSYLLIGFWFEKGKDGIGNALAAKKAFIVNRIGDFGVLIAIFILFTTFHTLDFDGIFSKVQLNAPAFQGVILAVTLFMLLGVTGKSAQLPLYVWLPDAMAGPTPVSALIHAATMVTAGVYLVARSNALYVAAPAAQAAVMWVGALTALFAATIAVAQFDIKKVLAYSTISQLGFMVAAVGMGAVTAAMFHLITHAFFKALLFLAAGSVILAMERGYETSEHGHTGNAEEFDPQDMRNMGNLQRRLPWTFWTYLMGALALSGIAPLAGFFSKDEILTVASLTSPWIFVLLILAAFLTAFYMGRQIFLVFFGQARSEAAGNASESSAVVLVPMVILAILSVIGGVLNLPGTTFLEKWITQTVAGKPDQFVLPLAVTSFALALIGLFMAWLVYGIRKPLAHPGEPDPLAPILGKVYNGMQNKWWVDEVYQVLFVRPYQSLSELLAQPVDLGAIDAIGNEIGSSIRSLGNGLRRWENGFVRSYALTLLIGLVVILAYLMVK
ncbi:MAG TPA: NADH-quinone oxidoreductase subunit L [Anaerolineaceae bacterium]|nr:NADH-quinone oxidoreductase subunit L [Anaerolineaceae bacterium]